MANLTNSVPETIKSGGPKSVARYLLGTTSLGMFYHRPEIRRAVAEEMLLSAIEPLVYMPNFLMREDILGDGWSTQRERPFSEAFRIGEEAATAMSQSLTPDARVFRRDLKLAALRKIDATINGQETFGMTPELAGEPYIEVIVCGHTFKLGNVTNVEYTQDISRQAAPLEFQNHELVFGLEQAIFPLISANTTPEAFNRAVLTWNMAIPFRNFERISKLPAFPGGIFLPTDVAPEGYFRRWTQEQVAAAGISLAETVMMGVPMYISEPARGFLQKMAPEVNRLMKDKTLPQRHLTQWLSSARLAHAPN